MMLGGFLFTGAAEAVATPEAGESTEQTICRLIEASAKAENLPVDYFTRLIWRESSFRPGVTSPAGAQGIAQFMPGTAEERGLIDPFDPETAIPASAGYLATLRARFGNLGLAAAAYNAGPTRLARWLTNGGNLPIETEDYVLFITGRTVADWAAHGASEPDDPLKGQIFADRARKAPKKPADCATIVAAVRKSAPSIYDGVYARYGVQLSGNFSKARAIATYERQVRRFPTLLAGKPTLILGSRAPGRGRRAFYRVRLPAATLKQAGILCRDLQRAGGSCVVLRN
ncbi:lytic transglycosylase [Kaistia algarum]|uniref:lytic transglycosylase domain-containing protein n=1 Tax=Kaistia algarum TaxID=2083279 RepID=UPI000CE91FAE|nr:lytic transglycosylase domain-containing protein [Kaistia algarum]MCX5514185.1 lytic transglycosylase domain-containing protein [Kaistia algarum]PPE77946.1 lytic transglycosylase [Kaistia algarum]